MINILLVCSGGMSTSMLAKRMQEAANKKSIDANIWAVGDVANIISMGDKDSYRASKKADVILLAPQIRYLLKTMRERVKDNIPVSAIEMTTFGTMNGELALEFALKVLNEFDKK
jgi:PTS system cellobiose-specific IIB component